MPQEDLLEGEKEEGAAWYLIETGEIEHNM